MPVPVPARRPYCIQVMIKNDFTTAASLSCLRVLSAVIIVEELLFKYLFSELILPSIIKEYLLLIKRYNLYKFVACSTTFFQLSLFCVTFFQLLMFMLFVSSKPSSSQCVLGLPIGLLDMGFHLCYIIYLLLFMVELNLPMCTP